MKAYLKNYRQSPRKVRLVADLIKGKSIAEARVLLETVPKRATGQIKKLLESAVANATHNDSVSENDLRIANVEVNKGVTLRRFRPRAQGRASRIRKFTSNISLALREQDKSEAPNSKSETPNTKAKTTQSKK